MTHPIKRTDINSRTLQLDKRNAPKVSSRGAFYLKDDPRADASYDRLRGLVAADPYAVGKKVEAFGMRRMHEDVLQSVESARGPVMSDAFYMAGVAAANLGERDKARRYLGRVAPVEVREALREQ